MTIKQFKDYSIPLLKRTSPSAMLDVEVLLQFYTGLSKTQLLLRQSEELTAAHKEALIQAVEKRLQGLPVAYIINKKEFFSYDFYVNQDVLIPKPDTELLVEKAIDYIIQKRELYPSARSEKIRTYNFPQDRVTDHRINYTAHNLPGFMMGDMDDMLDALNVYAKEEQLAADITELGN